MFFNLIQVAIGGAIGSVLRFLVNVGALRAFGAAYPAGTLAVNVVGSFAMGVLAEGLARRGAMHLAPLLMTGVLGGFTTFSAFSLDTLVLWERGQTAAALGYVALSLVLSIAALWAGLVLARGILA